MDAGRRSVSHTGGRCVTLTRKRKNASQTQTANAGNGPGRFALKPAYIR